MKRERGPLGHPVADRKLSERDKFKLQRQNEDLASVMATVPGRRFMWRLIDGLCAVQGKSFTGNSETFFREGRRSIGVDITTELYAVCPAEYIRMVQEQLELQREDTLVRKAIEDAAETDE